MFLYNEIVRFGNNTARIKNFYANNLVVLMDIQGEFKAGDTIVGDDSKYSYTFKNFEINSDYDIYHDPTLWDVNSELMINAITQDDGIFVVIDTYNDDTTESRDDNSTYLVILG